MTLLAYRQFNNNLTLSIIACVVIHGGTLRRHMSIIQAGFLWYLMLIHRKVISYCNISKQ